jgi:glycosyltransferase involved in cell wall biosynthesis
MKERFFSIIIPAHNEENYIGETIKAIKNVDYPREKLEVIIVENGSEDNTCKVIKSEIEGISMFSLISIKEKGVSKAKNTGMQHLSNDSDWVIFLDADTILLKDFLKNLNEYLEFNEKRHELAAGTTYVLPIAQSKNSELWFKFYNWGHKFTQSSFSIQIAKSSAAKKIIFDEDLSFEEDYKFLNDVKKQGKYFFFDTRSVLTSTRRFDSYGWNKLFFVWLSYVITPSFVKRKIRYKVIR